MNLNIEPYEGIGPIRFGMTRAQVRQVVPGRVEAFQKADTTTLTDAFDEHGIHVYYNEDDQCEAIEVATPARPALHGAELIGRPFKEMLVWFRQRDPGVKVDDAGLRSRKFGVGLYAPAARKAPEDPVEAVIVFRRNYYEDAGP